jgi:molecular chaperone GrpE
MMWRKWGKMTQDQNTPFENTEEETGSSRPEDMFDTNGNLEETTEEVIVTEDQPEETAPIPEAEPVQNGDEARTEAERNLAGWQRTLAEFQNYKRRVERENAERSTRMALDTISRILPIIDDFERALNNMPEELRENSWINGVTLIQAKFKKLLDDYDVEVIDPAGEPFDPNLHQAISKDDSDEVESDHVIDTVQKGYISGTHLLRPALVRVAN